MAKLTPPLIDATLDALKAGNAMKEATIAVARLLVECTCQRQRLPESRAALNLCESALDRWDEATKTMMRIAREQQARETTH